MNIKRFVLYFYDCIFKPDGGARTLGSCRVNEWIDVRKCLVHSICSVDSDVEYKALTSLRDLETGTRAEAAARHTEGSPLSQAIISRIERRRKDQSLLTDGRISTLGSDLFTQ